MSNSRKVLFFDIDGTLLYAKGSGRKAFQDAFYETYKIPINIDHINFSGATDLGVINKLFMPIWQLHPLNLFLLWWFKSIAADQALALLNTSFSLFA